MEISESYEGSKYLKGNLDFMRKTEGRYYTPTHSNRVSMTPTISIIFRSPRKRFVKLFLVVGVENIENSTYYERKNWFIVLKVH